MPHNSTRRTAVTAGVALTGLIAAPSAHAAFFTAGQLTGADTAPGIVTGPTAGQLAVAGADYDGGVSAAAHAPGGAFGATSVVATGTEDYPATFGTGGAVTSPSPTGPVARRLRPNGTVSGTVPVGTLGTNAIGTPAVAPGGALLAAVIDDAGGNLQLWRQAGDGQPAVPLAASFPQSVNAVDIEPIGPDAFVVLVASPTDGSQSGVALRSVTVTGSTVSAPRVVDDITDLDSGLSLLRAIPGTSQFALYVATVGATSVLRASALSGPAGPPKDITSVTGDDSIDDVRGLALPGGGAAVAWTKSDEEGTVTAAYAVLDAAGNKTCEVAEPLTAVALVDRGGPVLVGIDAAFRIVTVPVAAGCPAGVPAAGPVVTSAYELGAGVDADGTLVAVVTRDDGGPAAIVVDDATPPVIEPIDAPDEVRPDRAFDVSAAVFDPWGVVARTWSVNGDAISGTGALVTVPGQPAGTARVVASARNTAGLTATRSTDVRVTPDAPATPTPPRQPTTTQQPTTTTAPSGGRDTIAPRLSGVRIDRSLVRPLRATRALPRGATVRFTVSETARYRVTLLREALVPGARSRCDVPAGARGSSRKGQLHELKGSARKGTVRLRITGRDAQGKRLPRGRYRVSVRAIDAAGNWSATKYVRLTIC